MTSDIRHVLSLCTGNVDRSRFAEAMFRHLSWTRRLGWAALSRGLADDFRVVRPGGPMSDHAVEGLRHRGIAVPQPIRPPRKAHLHDLRSAHHIVAIDGATHGPMLETQFPSYAPRVEPWSIPEIDPDHPQDALATLAESVAGLMDRLEHLDAITGRRAVRSVA